MAKTFVPNDKKFPIENLIFDPTFILISTNDFLYVNIEFWTSNFHFSFFYICPPGGTTFYHSKHEAKFLFLLFSASKNS